LSLLKKRWSGSIESGEKDKRGNGTVMMLRTEVGEGEENKSKGVWEAREEGGRAKRADNTSLLTF